VNGGFHVATEIGSVQISVEGFAKFLYGYIYQADNLALWKSDVRPILDANQPEVGPGRCALEEAEMSSLPPANS
jgi:hypothetical protein